MNNIPRNIFVLIIAKKSNPLESFTVKIWVTISVIIIKPASNSKEKTPVIEEIIKNQNENPAVTANDLNLGDDNSILNRIDECYQTTLSKCCYTN